ncbi:MAG TPA: MFS transporter [Candidatus Lustribacter sp.]|nr:MFS transporter [Candidatus Lustribacter sp.]
MHPAQPATKSVAGHALDPSTIPLLVTLGLGVFAGALDLGVLSPALPALGIAFGVGARALPWVFTLYLLANVVSIPIMTKLADRNGRRPVYIACVAIFAAGSVLAIASQSWPMFLCARAIQAFGAGGIFPVATAAIADRIPPERRGAALGLVAATWGVAAIVGPLAGGLVTHFLSWHWIFAANVPLAIVVIVLARRTLPVTIANVRGPLDVAGIALLALGLLGLMLGLTQYDVTGATSNLQARLWLTAGIVALIAFALAERRAREPVIPPRFFTDGQLALVYGLEVLIGILEGALFFIPAALVAAQHLSYAAAGAVAAIGAVMFVVVIPGAGRALDAIGSRAVLAAGTTLTAAGLALFAFGLGNMWTAVGAMIVAGSGFGALLGAPTRYIVTNRAGSQQRSAAVGLLSVCLILGQILGGSLAGGVIGSHADLVDGFHVAYLWFTGVAVIAGLVTFGLHAKTRERAEART